MKRFGNLYESITSLENLYKAEKKARKGKSKNKEIKRYIQNLDENILELYNELQNNTYTTSEYSHFIIYEPKERFISKLPYRDRIVQHALMIYLEPIFTKSLISQTYSCIKKRGILKCLNTLTSYLKNKEATKYCLKLDIRKFYPSVDSDILKKALRTKIKDEKVLFLLDGIISSCKGLPLGSYTSQWLANFYLNKFSHWMKEEKRIKYFLTYCDDIVILHNSKEYLHTLRKEIQEYLLTHLKLELSNYQIFPVKSRGIDYLGYKSYHAHIKLRKTIKSNFRNMIRKHPNNKSIASYNGWLLHGNCRNLWNKYVNNLTQIKQNINKN